MSYRGLLRDLGSCRLVIEFKKIEIHLSIKNIIYGYYVTILSLTIKGQFQKDILHPKEGIYIMVQVYTIYIQLNKCIHIVSGNPIIES